MKNDRQKPKRYRLDGKYRSLPNRIALGVAVMVSVVSVLVVYCRRGGEKKPWRIFKIMFLAFSPAAVFVAAFLPLVALEQCQARSRIFISVGGFLFYMGIMLAYAGKKRRYAVLTAAVCLVCQYLYMYAYGNALGSQNEYEKYMVYSIVHDLEEINGGGEYSELTFMGEAPRSRQLQMTCEKYPKMSQTAGWWMQGNLLPKIPFIHVMSMRTG